jgi:Tetratricopeptide repeat
MASAVAAMQEVLDVQLRVLGPEDPTTLKTRADLAGWRVIAGDEAGAVAMLQELLDDQRRVLGPDHPDTVDTEKGLAYLRAGSGKFVQTDRRPRSRWHYRRTTD